MLHNKSLSPLRALPPLRDEEWFITNLESVLGAPLQAWPLKAYHFQSDPALFPRLLKSARINPQRLIVSLANNHALDFDVQGLQSTLSTLEDLGVHHVGAGEDAATAWRPIIVGERGARLGILAVTDHCGCLDMCGWVAGAGRSGVAYRELSWGDQSPLLDAVKSLRAQAEGVIISLHSGPNYLDHPAKWMRNLAHQLIEAGADIIHFHSAHHVLPIERYRGRLIAYGLGDLLNDYKLNSQYRNDLGSTAVVTITPQQGGGRQLTVQLRPHQIRGGTLQTLKSDHPDFQWVMAHLSPDQTKK